MAKKSLKINAALNVIKQLCQVLFPLISIPYITRVLQPENYGKINYGNSIVSYFVLLAALGINTYSVREGVAYRDNKKKFGQFVSEIFSINIFSTIVSYLLLTIVLMFPSMEGSRKLIAIQSLVIILTTIGTDWINTIYEDYIYITVRYVVFQLISIVLMFLLVRSSDDYLIYAAIVVGSSAGANVLNFFHVRKYAKIHFTLNIDWKRHLTPILVFFANIFAITIYVNSDITMLGVIRGDTEVGIYTLASKVYSIVKQLLNAVIVVTVPRLSYLIKKNLKEKFYLLAFRIQKALILIIFPATFGVMILRREIIELVGGASYLQGTSTLFILSGAIVFSLLATFYTSCIMVPLKLEKYVLIATIVSALTNVCLNFIFIPWLGCDGAAITTLISELIVCVVGGYQSLKNGKMKVELMFIFKVIFGCCFVISSCMFIRSFDFNTIYRTIISVMLSSLLYFLVEIIVRNDFLTTELRSIIRKKDRRRK